MDVNASNSGAPVGDPTIFMSNNVPALVFREEHRRFRSRVRLHEAGFLYGVMVGRIRTIKPDFFLSEELGELTLYARLAFPGLWIQADRDGKMKDRPRKLKAQILPYDKVDFNKILIDLHNAGFINRYTVNGEKYIIVNNFLKHQRPHAREVESTFPDPPLNNPPLREGNGEQERKGMENGACTTKVVPEHHQGSAPIPYDKIINDLNTRLGAKYRPTSHKTQVLISARFNEGSTLEDFIAVNTKKCDEWVGTEYAKFLRPETLYGTKFEGYVNQQIVSNVKCSYTYPYNPRVGSKQCEEWAVGGGEHCAKHKES